MRTECSCGCGEPAPLATRFDKRHGYEIGEPKKYIRGHNNLKKKKPVRFVDANTMEIPLTRGYVAWIDSNCRYVGSIEKLQWHAQVQGDHVYAAANDDDGRLVLLHRMVMEAELGVVVKRVGFINKKVEGGSVIDCRMDNLEVKQV